MTEAVKPVLDKWLESFGHLLESMIDSRPELSWKDAEAGPAEAAGVLWWEQSFQYPPGARVWVGAAQNTWEPAGTLTLKAAGLETVERNEARNTWLEIVGQSMAALARILTGELGRPSNCDAGAERSPVAETGEQALVEIRIAGTVLPLTIVVSPDLVEQLSTPQPAPEVEEAREEAAVSSKQRAKNSATLDLLLDIDLPVSISFGSAQLPLKEVVKLNTGSIVELDRLVGEPVEVLVNQRLIARGEVVVVDGNYGVRIQEIVSQKERLRSIQ